LTSSRSYKVFGRRHDEAIDALMRPATEKRQGTKSRWGMCGGAASTMGFRRGAWINKFGLKWLGRWFWR
jgi:hypothetical protein